MENIITIKEKIVNVYKDFTDSTTFDFNLLREKLDEIFQPSLIEKQKNAEVPTPHSLIEEMLDKFPPSFWQCKERKVFEPSCGKGGFLLSLFERFFEGLNEAIPNKVDRCRHIFWNNLFFADISEYNIFITRELLICHAAFKANENFNYFKHTRINSFCDNSLGYRDSLWSRKFDAVVGNPPFNNPNQHKNIIWTEFVYRALEVWIKDGGYLAFIHPPGWRKPFTRRQKGYTNIYDLITCHNQLIYLSIHGKKDGWALFNCGTRFDWYFLRHSQNELTLPYPNVQVSDEDRIVSEIDISKWKWLPSKNFELIQSILVQDNNDIVEERCPILYSRSAYGTDKSWMSNLENKEFGFIHPCIHSTLKGGVVRYYYSKVCNRGFFGVPKVIFGESGIFEPILDLDGTYGLTHCAMAIQISDLEEGEKIVAALKSDKFDDLIQSCCFSSFRIDWRMFIDFRRDFYLKFI
jgi:hypothetical protein